MDDDEDIITNTNLKCKVCGEHKFALREGFYYCLECGTKQEQVRAVEIEHDEDFLDSKGAKSKKIKLKKLKSEKPELTSWECYNYILRGLVGDLLSFGAKEELKLMTLQLWAAYLRRMEVAFFNKKHVELPKLGLRFLQRDAKAIYNHAEGRRARKRKRKEEASVLSSERASSRKWRKSKRQLDESTYSLHSSMVSTERSQTSLSMSMSSANTSSTGTTGRAIQLKFSARARKQLKKIMPVKHIEKHAMDGEGSLKCHNLKPLARSISRSEHALHTLNVRQIYTILAIALNLINDDIQLCDLVRFINEEHITTKNVLRYFPENIMPHCKVILQQIQFNVFPTKYSDKVLRDHIGLLAKFLNIRQFTQPSILKLAERYITELNLPPDITTYVERLITLLPPQMRTRAPHIYPGYEARAMAYIIFVLKLLFGLDGHKEKLISKSAKEINQRIRHLSQLKRCDVTPSLLFVWQDWVEYIEMRKVIVSFYNSRFCRQFNQCQSTAQLLEVMEEEQQLQQESNLHTVSGGVSELAVKVANMNKIFQQFVANFGVTRKSKQQDSIAFSPSYTPAHSYFKRILLHHSSGGASGTLKIPEYMRVDHTQRTVEPYMHEKLLKEFFETHKWQLNVERIACTGRRSYVGIFRTPLDRRDYENRYKPANFDISTSEWLESIVEEPLIEELEFKTELDHYERNYQKKLQSGAKRKLHLEKSLPNWLRSNDVNTQMHDTAIDDAEILSMHSFNVFSEYDMAPIENLNLPAPRRNLNQVKLFAHLSDDESNERNQTADESAKTAQSVDAEPQQNTNADRTPQTITLVTSKMDYWTLLGFGLGALTGAQKKNLESKFSRTFFWLLETCAQTIGVDWCLVYEQLLAIEIMFAYGVEDLDGLQECIQFKYNNPIKDFNILVNLYREIW